jgi:hypothetical protein
MKKAESDSLFYTVTTVVQRRGRIRGGGREEQVGGTSGVDQICANKGKCRGYFQQRFTPCRSLSTQLGLCADRLICHHSSVSARPHVIFSSRKQENEP